MGGNQGSVWKGEGPPGTTESSCLDCCRLADIPCLIASAIIACMESGITGAGSASDLRLAAVGMNVASGSVLALDDG